MASGTAGDNQLQGNISNDTLFGGDGGGPGTGAGMGFDDYLDGGIGNDFLVVAGCYRPGRRAKPINAAAYHGPLHILPYGSCGLPACNRIFVVKDRRRDGSPARLSSTVFLRA